MFYIIAKKVPVSTANIHPYLYFLNFIQLKLYVVIDMLCMEIKYKLVKNPIRYVTTLNPWPL